MTDSSGLATRYQWHLRPRMPARPQWFRQWPDRARLAILVFLLHEWESIPRHRGHPLPAGVDDIDFLALTWREYGVRHGIWRLLDTLDRRSVAATMMVSGVLAELFPEGITAAKQRGHEIAAHQWDQATASYTYPTRDAERDALAKTKTILEEVSGAPVVGYMSPGRRSTSNTLPILAELGFLWTSDYLNSDIPQVLNVDGRSLISVGYNRPGSSDADLLKHGLVNALTEVKFIFDAAYAEAAQHPMRMCIAIHTGWGATGMARMLDEFLTYAQSHDGVWFARGYDVANFWLAHAGED